MNPYIFTVTMVTVGRVGIERAHPYTVEARTEDDAIRAAWDQAERDTAGLELIVLGPECVNGKPVDSERDWNAVREAE